jgi:[phosphatase 2A protein]-leucine-carboxy methyltransferase
LDEVEEWELLARHYCVAWGWKELVEDDGGGAKGCFGRAWGEVEGGETKGEDDGDVEMMRRF